MITCNTASSKDIKVLRYSPLNSVRTMCDFINYDTDSLVKLHIFQIKRSLTLDRKWHHGREHSQMPITLVNIIKNPLYFINI